MRRRGESTTRGGWLASLILGVLLVSGCAPVSDDLSAGSAARLQTMVVSVAETAATGDIAAALAELDALQVALDEARARGEVSDERAATIQAALDRVRADLEALLPPPPEIVPSAPAEEQTPVEPDEEEDEDGKGNGNDGNGDGNDGNGNDGNGDRNDGNGDDRNGNGNGNRNGNGNSGNGNGGSRG